tara:strand:- start:10 stop:1677 length:1668 start_codon:yes stop_codon:yes gene_type:complete
MGRTQNKTNPVEDFNDNNKFQISKISTFQKYTGSATRKMEAGTNSYYTTTRVSQNGKDDKGNIIYKREIIMFDSKEKMKAFEDLGSANKSQLGANGGGVVIATGSTEKGKKSFELTEAGANIDFVKNNEEKIQKQSANQVKNIIKDENYKVKSSLNSFSNNRKAENKDDSIDAKAEEANNKAEQDRLNTKLARGQYGTMVYPSHIKDSVQDKLKISIIKPRKANLSNTKREKFISKKSGNTNLGTKGVLLPDDYPNLDPVKFPKLSKYNNMQGTYQGMTIRNGFQRNQDRIYAAGENQNADEYGESFAGHIFLPIPDGVTDQNKVNFGSGTLNPLQKRVSGVALKFLLEGVKEGGKDAQAVFKKTVKDPDTKKALSNLIAGSATGIDTDELLARTQGSILNNNLALLFKGPALRTFTFQFILSPRDRGEALEVQKIIRALKQSSAAQRTPGGTFLGAPNLFRLEFLNGLTRHKFLPRVKKCALLSVGVNYMPENSYMTYEDTSMVSYSLSLSFQETEALYNDDYDNDLDKPVEELSSEIFSPDFAGQTKKKGIGF